MVLFCSRSINQAPLSKQIPNNPLETIKNHKMVLKIGRKQHLTSRSDELRPRTAAVAPCPRAYQQHPGSPPMVTALLDMQPTSLCTHRCHTHGTEIGAPPLLERRLESPSPD
jgi:hypothetical protein